MLFELVGKTALNAVVPAVVRPRCHLIDEDLAFCGKEELHGEKPYLFQAFRNPQGHFPRLIGKGFRDTGRT